MIFPSLNTDDFFNSLLKYLAMYGMLLMFCCIPTFIYMMVSFPEELVLLRFFDILLFLFPPSLQPVFGFYITMSLLRLKKIGVNGINPDKMFFIF